MPSEVASLNHLVNLLLVANHLQEVTRALLQVLVLLQMIKLRQRLLKRQPRLLQSLRSRLHSPRNLLRPDHNQDSHLRHQLQLSRGMPLHRLNHSPRRLRRLKSSQKLNQRHRKLNRYQASMPNRISKLRLYLINLQIRSLLLNKQRRHLLQRIINLYPNKLQIGILRRLPLNNRGPPLMRQKQLLNKVRLPSQQLLNQLLMLRHPLVDLHGSTFQA